MNIVKKLFGFVEDYLSIVMRVVLTFAVSIILIYTLVTAISGYMMSNKQPTVKTGANGANYSSIEELIFPKQVSVQDDEEEDEEEEEVERVYDPKIEAIYESMSLHFKDGRANRDQFKENFKPENLEAIMLTIVKGEYSLGGLSRSAFPRNAKCSSGDRFPEIAAMREPIEGDQVNLALAMGITEEDIDALNDSIRQDEREYQRFLSQLADFWEDAEPRGSLPSQYESITSYRQREATVWATNDLFLCGWIKSQDALDAENAQSEADAKSANNEGDRKLMTVGASLVAVFTFFAAFALVLLSIILVRIEGHLRK